MTLELYLLLQALWLLNLISGLHRESKITKSFRTLVWLSGVALMIVAYQFTGEGNGN